MNNPSTTYSVKRKGKRWRRGIAAVIGLLLVLLTADYFLYPVWSPVGGRSFNTGRNGTWLRDSWYRGTEAETPDALARQLTAHQMRYAYFHTRFIKKNGTIRYRPDARTVRGLTSALRQRAPDVKLIAWAYVGNERGLTGVDIGDATVRQAMVGEALWLVRDCGFDGVQWDYEICEDGNKDLLALLTETRRALPKGAMLCLSTPMWLPGPLRDWGWSEAYFGKIAATCDQIAVMIYDSGLYLPRHYVWLVRQQAVHVTRAVARANPACRVLLGVPTYEDGGASHHPHAENIYLALKGVREGLADPNADTAVFDGVAIFGDYTTDDTEWETYQRLWLR